MDRLVLLGLLALLGWMLLSDAWMKKNFNPAVINPAAL